MAMANVLAERPDLPMLGSDAEHESMAGTYLAAATIYATLFDREPGGPYRPASLSEGTLPSQRIAWETVDEWRTGARRRVGRPSALSRRFYCLRRTIGLPTQGVGASSSPARCRGTSRPSRWTTARESSVAGGDEARPLTMAAWTAPSHWRTRPAHAKGERSCVRCGCPWSGRSSWCCSAEPAARSRPRRRLVLCTPPALASASNRPGEPCRTTVPSSSTSSAMSARSRAATHGSAAPVSTISSSSA